MGAIVIPIIIISLLSLLTHSSSISFSFPNFRDTKDIIMNGTSIYVSGDSYLQLTENDKGKSYKNNTGRATYKEEMLLWDKVTGKFADFSTNFSFRIYSENPSYYGDGMAFFISPRSLLDIPLANSAGGSLGLVDADQELNPKGTNQFVAVEFDTYSNYFDPLYVHVGIDINSLKSNTNSSWEGGINFVNQRHEAWISYNSTTTNFSVEFTNYDSNNVLFRNKLSYLVNLTQYLPERVVVGFSAATGADFESHTITSWNFTSSLEESVAPQTKTTLIVALAVGGFALVCGLCIVLLYVWKKRQRANEEDELVFGKEEFDKGTGPKKFHYAELSRATNKFDEREKLGEGGFGEVYKGFLKDTNSFIAVKRISSRSKQGIKEYRSEVKIISRLRHRNLVQLVGWCHENKEFLLVYEFLPNGSLDYHLFRETSVLTWDTRYRIAQDLAYSLRYLHEEGEQCVIHRDIKASNIMLDSSFNAKLGDFGLARLVDHDKGSETTIIAGTMGYMAPECLTTGKFNKESDVYSFGIVALEIASGRKSIQTLAREGRETRLVDWVWELYERGKLVEALDSRLCGDFDEKQMERLMIVGLWCVHPVNNLRPSIAQAIHVLNFEAPLPIIQPKMSVLAYLASPLTADALLSQYSGSTGYEQGQSQPSSDSNFTNSSKVTSSSTSSATALLHSREMS